MNIEQERAEFEDCFDSLGVGPFQPHNNMYVADEIQARWEAWQARAALQSRDRDKDRIYAERYRWLRADNAYFPEENHIWGGQELDAAIDHALRIEGEGE